MLGKGLSQAAQNFRLNMGLEPQLVSGAMPSPGSSSINKITNKLDDFSKARKLRVSNLDEVGEGALHYSDAILLKERIKGLESSIKIKSSVSSEEINRWWATQGYVEPPYTAGTSVQIIELTEEVKFVRVYDGENSGLYGGWLMKPEDIQGLTPVEIQQKFALPHLPKYVGEVTLPKGSTLRMGEVNPLFGFKGGGLQFDLMGQYIGKFEEIGLISR